MPFDDTNFDENHGFSPLYFAMGQLGIRPIIENDFLSYKQEEESKYPPTVLYRYRKPIKFSIYMVSATFLVMTAMNSTNMMFSLLMFLLSAMSLAIGLCFFPTTPAEWEERIIPGHVQFGIPFEISDMYNSIRKLLPDAHCIIGALTIDGFSFYGSYLYVVHGNDKAVLGVWNGSKIIMKATRSNQGITQQ